MGAVRGARDLLVLSGGCGTGKTVAAAAWLREYVATADHWEDGAGTKQIPIFARRRQSGLRPRSSRESDHYDQHKFDCVAKTRRLAIDDLGAEYQDAKGFFGALLDELIDARYSGMRPTVITTNLDAEAVKALWRSHRDRVREAGRFVGCGSESLRKRRTPPAKPRDPSVGHYPASPDYPVKTGRMQMP